jgi:hypothetical protein
MALRSRGLIGLQVALTSIRAAAYYKLTVKAILVLALLAAGLAAGCGSGKVLGSLSVTGPTVTTVASVKTGALIRCDGSVGAKVPPPGHGVSGSADGSSPALSAEIDLKRLPDGSLVVSCRP